MEENAAHRDWIRSVAFASAAPVLAAGSGDGTASVWTVTGHRLDVCADDPPDAPVGRRSAPVHPGEPAPHMEATELMPG